jgi:8-oxo-dGTP pyrophosphatase MutT (NUDIX family)
MKMKRMRGKPRSQVAALPIRRVADGVFEIMLITTRTTRRWIVPKGWPVKGIDDSEAAAREAREEAGVIGKIEKKPVGRYIYWKRMRDHFALCKVSLFILEAERQLEHWPERGERLFHWFKLHDAADLVDDPGLGAAIRSLKLR